MSAGTKDDAGVHRLLDIVVEEVSLVDRAANKRRFLIVKRSDPMDETTTETPAGTDETATTDETPAGTDAPETDATDSGADSDAIAVAVEALEQLTEAVEQLGGAGGGDSTSRVAELASALRAAAEQLAEAAGVESAALSEGDAIDQVAAEVRSTLERVNTLLDGAKRPAPKADSAPPAENAAAGAAEGERELGERIGELIASVRQLTTTVTEQQQRLARLEKRFGLPNSAPTRERPARPDDEDVGWPLDLNRPFDRESVDKAISFHDV